MDNNNQIAPDTSKAQQSGSKCPPRKIIVGLLFASPQSLSPLQPSAEFCLPTF